MDGKMCVVTGVWGAVAASMPVPAAAMTLSQ
jgi:hypothetical protein